MALDTWGDLRTWNALQNWAVISPPASAITGPVPTNPLRDRVVAVPTITGTVSTSPDIGGPEPAASTTTFTGLPSALQSWNTVDTWDALSIWATDSPATAVAPATTSQSSITGTIRTP